jgi:hypothetical protein
MDITTLEMEIAAADFFNIRRNTIVPNLHWGLDFMHECDIFVASPTGQCTEIEIKVSKKDIIADKKKKHNHIDKLNRIKNFYFAVPKELAEFALSRIPSHAGLLVATKENIGGKVKVRLRCKRNCVPDANARKLYKEEQDQVLRLSSMRIWAAKGQIHKLCEEIQQLKEELKKGLL